MCFLIYACILQDELERNIIPQVPLFDLLNKFNGVTEKVYTIVTTSHDYHMTDSTTGVQDIQRVVR